MSKYLNKKITIDGRVFDSIKEGNRYSELKMLQKTGMIEDLECQPKFEIIDSVKWNGKTLRKRVYIADFAYTENGQEIVEDVKSEFTKKNPVYTLKRQLFLLQYGKDYEFREV